MNIIVDYGLGNLASVSRGFKRAGIETKISRDINEIKNMGRLPLGNRPNFHAVIIYF